MKLNIGCGPSPLPGYVNLDRKMGGEALPLRLNNGDAVADGSCAEVRASHILEHFPHAIVGECIREWVRVLRPGGVLKIAVPDFDTIVREINDGNPKGLPLLGYIYGGQGDRDDYHHCGFNDVELADLLESAGLTDVRRWDSDAKDCSSLSISLNLQGRKPMPGEAKTAYVPTTPPPGQVESKELLPGVHAILSMPRLCFTDQAVCLIEGVSRFKIPIRIRQGVFWGQTMTNAMEQAIAEGAQYLLAIDYDSLFIPADVQRLYRLMVDNPHADAIAAVQIGRDRNSPLLTIRAASGDGNVGQVDADAVYNADLLRINTAHFGLTMIRVEAVRRMSKPWFLHQPDPSGSWGDGRLDEDIYFWREWEKAGNTLYSANKVRIGHMQLMATWPTPDLEPVHQYMTEWRKQGKPQGVA